MSGVWWGIVLAAVLAMSTTIVGRGEARSRVGRCRGAGSGIGARGALAGRWWRGGRTVADDAAGVGSRTRPGLQLTLTAVVAALRAGRSVEEAWLIAGVTFADDRLPHPDDLTERARLDLAPEGKRRSRKADGGTRRSSTATDLLVAQQVVTVRAACRIAAELGTPLAQVLDEVSSSIAAHREAYDERQAALAGPRASARLLAWLPVVTCAGAALLGAEPWRTAADGGPGTLAALLGVVLLLAGRTWTERLLASAEAAADGTPRTARTRPAAVRRAAR